MKEARELANATDQYFAQPLDVSIVSVNGICIYQVSVINATDNINVQFMDMACRTRICAINYEVFSLFLYTTMDVLSLSFVAIVGMNGLS